MGVVLTSRVVNVIKCYARDYANWEPTQEEPLPPRAVVARVPSRIIRFAPNLGPKSSALLVAWLAEEDLKFAEPPDAVWRAMYMRVNPPPPEMPRKEPLHYWTAGLVAMMERVYFDNEEDRQIAQSLVDGANEALRVRKKSGA